MFNTMFQDFVNSIICLSGFNPLCILNRWCVATFILSLYYIICQISLGILNSLNNSGNKSSLPKFLGDTYLTLQTILETKVLWQTSGILNSLSYLIKTGFPRSLDFLLFKNFFSRFALNFGISFTNLLLKIIKIQNFLQP